MKSKKEISSAVEILHRRYIKDDSARKLSLATERVNAEIAQMIYDLRTDAGLTQKDLSELMGTTQSVISRLEDADYEGHSLSMLNRIARALNQKLTVMMTTNEPEGGELRYTFQRTLEDLRRSKGLSVSELAKRTGIDHNEIIAMERDHAYRPAPMTLHVLSEFYGIPSQRLAALAGAFREIPDDIREPALRYAAQSESFARLTKAEQKALDEFVKHLKKETGS